MHPKKIVLKYLFSLCFFLVILETQAQYVSTSPFFYTEQELVETVLFGATNCVENINVTNSVSGNYANSRTFGFFESNNSGFPFESGLVLSTGQLSNVDGPNDNLSDDGNDDNWVGDADLETAVGLSPGETLNATSLQFEFTPKANNLSFRYIFASEEYQEGNANTCRFSDAFAFLIRPANSQNAFENIALVPGTNTPVLVTSVHPEIPGNNGCPAENENYFGQFNTTEAPTNFNGRTAVLTATTNVVANQTYEIKLVIADETNYRYDSAVFIEANSFNIGADLGQDLTGINALCTGSNSLIELSPSQAGNIINWFYEGTEILSNQNNLSLEISEANFGAGTYGVSVELANGCSATDELEVEFISPENYDDFSITQCSDQTGVSQFDLTSVLTEVENLDLISNGFYESIQDANSLNDPIENPETYELQTDATVYVAVQNEAGCSTFINLNLNLNTTILNPINIETCADASGDLIVSRTDILTELEASTATINSSSISLHSTQDDAANQVNELTAGSFNFTTNQSLFARLANDANCAALVEFTVTEAEKAVLTEDEIEVFLCLNESFSINLTPNLENNSSSFSYVWSTGETTPSINVNSTGNYSVEISNLESFSQCAVTQNFNVLVSETAEISYELLGTPENYEVLITANGQGDYEYALNTSGFQDENRFRVTAAQNTIFVQDKNGCGLTSLDFQVMQFPEFFTPNNDGYNDVWRVDGPAEQKFQILKIEIFNRYGKPLSTLFQDQLSWDGTYKGQNLPSDDYWFLVEFRDGQSYTDHFTLKR